MRPILCGIETEYGLYIEGRGAEEQIDDAMALVRSYPSERRVNWDYRFESPRADLRGFSVDRLTFDPEDAKFDRGRRYRGADSEVRSDVILPNGARFYNDHGHPEYSTPECWSLDELAAHDVAGQAAVLRAARNYERPAKLYKNNTDFHGASYGTHESYLVPRALPFQALYEAVLPMLVVRPILCGAGKVGSESGQSCAYQISQRADFFSEPLNVETLFRRPIFNTRDEPHANPQEWIRLHVICGDANMIPAATKRKVGLVKLAIRLAEVGEAPKWNFSDAVSSAKAISRDDTMTFEASLSNRSWTNAYEIFESYFAAADRCLDDPELAAVIEDCRQLLPLVRENSHTAAASIDWMAKRTMLEQIMESEGSDWRDPSLTAYDLEYSNVDPEEGLYFALADMGITPPMPDESARLDHLPQESTRAQARAAALKFPELTAASWGFLIFGDRTVALDPEREYVDLPTDFEGFLAAIG